MSADPLISVLLPVRNGSGRLQHCLESLQHQDLPRAAYEIIVADGRSTDDTLEIARSYECIVVDNPQLSAAGGRNAAFAVSRGKFIAVTEDDIVLPPGWLSAGIRALADEAASAVGGPTPIPVASRPFARSVDLIFRASAGIGYSVQSGVSGPVRAVKDIPGGNAMYRREILEAVMPEDLRLVTGEEVDLHIRLQALGGKLVFSPDFLAWHHKRDTPARFFRQMRLFARGRVQVGRLHKEALRPMHRLVATLPAALILALALISPVLLACGVAAGAAAAVLAGLVAGVGIRASLWLPVSAGLFLLAWAVGFFQEVARPGFDPAGR